MLRQNYQKPFKDVKFAKYLAVRYVNGVTGIINRHALTLMGAETVLNVQGNAPNQNTKDYIRLFPPKLSNMMIQMHIKKLNMKKAYLEQRIIKKFVKTISNK